jgi:hypothetical protein
MPLDLSALPLNDLPPALLFFAAAMGLAVIACLALTFSGGGVRRRLKEAEDAARGLKAEIRSLSGERDAAKTEHGLADQNFRYIAEKIGLDAFSSDEEKKNFIDAVGAFARNGDIAGMLKVRQVELQSALGMSGEELSDLMTFRNHIDAEWIRQPAKAAKSLDVLAARLGAIGQMEAVWRDKTSTVAEARQLLSDNMWVFEPDYVVSKGRVFTDRTIASIAGAADSNSGLRPDIVAMTALSASLQSGHQWRDIHRTGLLVVDLKGTGTRIGAAEKQKASDYAKELTKAGLAKSSTSVDCYVVGKEVDEDEGAPRIEGWGGNVRIIALSYDQLIARAKRMTLDLMRVLAQTPERFDDKVHALPAAEPEVAESMEADASVEEEVYDRDQDAGETEAASAMSEESDADDRAESVVASSDEAAEGAEQDENSEERYVDPQPQPQTRPMRRRMAAE